jgi:putative peptidoglycan lipid II flippase
MIGLAALQINLIVLTFFASFVGDSSISALNFAMTILLFPVGLFGMSLAMAMFPTLAERAAEGGLSEVQEMVGRALRFTLFLTIPAAVGMTLLHEPLVRALFERGAFDAEATGIVSSALIFYAIGLPAHAAIEILSRGFYALGDTRTPVGFAVAAMLINLVLAAALVDALAIEGLALALSIASIIESLGLFIVLHGRLEGGLWTRPVASTVYRIVIATALMGQTVGLLLLALNDTGNFGPRSFFSLLAGVTVGVVVYYLAALLLRLEEAHIIAARVQGLMRRTLPDGVKLH